ncbi:unnamed protein product [Spirodela intermedia]|uniref:CP12 domain-containing protein n=1 Tax=Spirodela intermedia TaxID=51605 RepID=A0A7I8LBT5_SPIIN|nr:unnamed protein product [Spirodela intermedia]
MREKLLGEMIVKKVIEAEAICSGDGASDECEVAWDEVEEVSRAKAELRRPLTGSERDPLDSCQHNPEAEECRVYED